MHPSFRSHHWIAVVILYFSFEPTGALGQTQRNELTLQELKRAQTLEWNVRVYAKAGRREGGGPGFKLVNRSKTAFQSPTFYRDTRFDTEGNVQLINIVDLNDSSSLLLNMQTKEATWMLAPINVYGPETPLQWLTQLVEKMPSESLGHHTIDNRQLEIFRIPGSVDLWIGADSNKVFGVSIPGSDRFNPLNISNNDDASAKTPPSRPVGQIRSDIVYGQSFDKELFLPVIPDGFSVKQQQPKTPVDEAELIEWFDVTSRFNDDAFLETAMGTNRSKYNNARRKPESDRSSSEHAMIELVEKHTKARNLPPISAFLAVHAVPGTFRYAGDGVKRGDGEKVLCWYKTKQGEYRAIYGNLKAATIAEEDLPLMNKQ